MSQARFTLSPPLTETTRKPFGATVIGFPLAEADGARADNPEQLRGMRTGRDPQRHQRPVPVRAQPANSSLNRSPGKCRGTRRACGY